MPSLPFEDFGFAAVQFTLHKTSSQNTVTMNSDTVSRRGRGALARNSLSSTAECLRVAAGKSKKECRYSHYYAKFDAFQSAICACLATAPLTREKELKPLLTLKFQTPEQAQIMIV